MRQLKNLYNQIQLPYTNPQFLNKLALNFNF